MNIFWEFRSNVSTGSGDMLVTNEHTETRASSWWWGGSRTSEFWCQIRSVLIWFRKKQMDLRSSASLSCTLLKWSRLFLQNEGCACSPSAFDLSVMIFPAAFVWQWTQPAVIHAAAESSMSSFARRLSGKRSPYWWICEEEERGAWHVDILWRRCRYRSTFTQTAGWQWQRSDLRPTWKQAGEYGNSQRRPLLWDVPERISLLHTGSTCSNHLFVIWVMM